MAKLKTTKTENKELTITLIKSLSRTKPQHRLTITALGLKRVGTSVVRPDNASVRGMITQVGYLLDIK